MDRQTLERILAPLFRCHECNGRGKMEYAIWTKLPHVDPTRGNEVSDTEPARSEYRDCESCKGTGRAHVSTEGEGK